MNRSAACFAAVAAAVVIAFGAPGAASAHRARVVTVVAPRTPLLLEVASTPRARERGLMFRRRLEPRTGMLFVFDDDAERTFWMEHTLVPLDMVFVDASGRVTGIASNVPAMRPGDTEASVARRHGVGRYVIELPGGEAAADGLAVGTKLSFDAVFR